MKRILIILLSTFSGGVSQASDIFKAIETKNLSVVQKALKSNVNLNVRNKDGQTPLIFAVTHGSKNSMDLLLKRGVDVNDVGALGKTALDYAIELKFNHKVRCLVKHGAKVSSEKNLRLVQKVLKHRARCFMGIGLGLLGFVAFGTFHSLFVSTLPCCPSCMMFAIGLETLIAGAGVGTLIPGAYWYRMANNVQVL